MVLVFAEILHDPAIRQAINGLTVPNQNSGVLRCPFLGAFTILVPNEGNRRWIASGCPPNPGEDGRHRCAGKERLGGRGNVPWRGTPDNTHLQFEETSTLSWVGYGLSRNWAQ